MKFWKKKQRKESTPETEAGAEREYIAEALEARVLYSAAPAPVAEAPVEVEEAPAVIGHATDANFESIDGFVAAGQAPVEGGEQIAAPAQTELDSDQIGSVLLPDSFDADALAAEAEALKKAAIDLWISDGGISAEQAAALAEVNVHIVDLDPTRLGAADGMDIYLDWNAAGLDWFIDETPLLNEEFSPATSFGTLRATDLEAANAVDMLTILTHEMGHVLGLQDSSARADGIMYGYFGEGERRLLVDGLADGAEVGSLEGAQYATADAIAYDPILIGTDPSNGEYAAGAFANGTVNPTVSGFSGAWRGGTATLKITSTGLDHDSIIGEAGGAILFDWTNDFGGDRTAQRSLSNPPADSSPAIWTAGLVQLQGTHNNNGYAYAGFGEGNWGNSGPINIDTEGLLFGVRGDGTNMDLVFRHRDSGGTMTSRVLLDGISSGDTHLVIMKLTPNASGDDTVEIWVNPTNPTSESFIGTPTATFTDVSLGNPSSVITDLMVGANSALFEGVVFDELAIGTQLSDVVNPVGVFPTSPGMTLTGNDYDLTSLTRDGVTFTDLNAATAISVVANGGTNRYTTDGLANNNADHLTALTGNRLSNGLTNPTSVDFSFDAPVTDTKTAIYFGEISTGPSQSADNVIITPLDAGGNEIAGWSLSLDGSDFSAAVDPDHRMDGVTSVISGSPLYPVMTSFLITDFTGGSGTLTDVYGIRVADAGDDSNVFDPNVAGTFSLNLAPTAVDDDNGYAASVDGGSIGIPVLLNDTDPDNDVLSIDPTSLSTSAHGATLSLLGEASAITNVNLINGYEMEDLTLTMGGTAVTLTTEQLIGVDVTQFAGNNSTSLFLQDGASAPSAGNRAALLDTDNRLDTSLSNPVVGSIAQMNAGTNIGTTLEFDQAVSGAVMFEVWANNDPINVQVSSDGVNWSNAVLFNSWDSTISGLPAPGTMPFDVGTLGSTPGSLSDVENNSFSTAAGANQAIAGMVINASAFSGVTSFTHLRYSSADGDSVDPSFVRGIPPVVNYDPSTASASGTENDTFTYKVIDGNGGEDTATVTVSLTGVTAVDDDNNYAADVGGSSIAIPVLLNDLNPTDLSIDPASLTTSVQGATLTTSGEASAITNVNLVNGYELQDLTLTMSGTAVTLNPDQLIGIDVTQFTGNSSSTLFVENGTSAPDAGSRAEVLDTDNRLDTALANPLVGSVAQMNAGTNIGTTVQFDQAVNGAVMFEVWANNDPINVQVSSDGVNWSNAVTFNSWDSSIPGLPAAGTMPFDVYAGTSSTLNDVETNSFSKSADATQALAGMVINASAFSGVTSFTHLRYSSADSDTVDPSFIRGIPPVVIYDPTNAVAYGTVSDTFTYKAIDGKGGEDTGTVTVSLTGLGGPGVRAVSPGVTQTGGDYDLVSLTRGGVTFTDLVPATAGSATSVSGVYTTDGLANNATDINTALTGNRLSNGVINPATTDFTFAAPVNDDYTAIYFGEITISTTQPADNVIITPLDASGNEIPGWLLDLDGSHFSTPVSDDAMTGISGTSETLYPALTSFLISDFRGGTGTLTGVHGIRVTDMNDDGNRVDPNVAGTFALNVFYVNDDWTQQSDITDEDGDLETAGIQNATFNFNAFGTLTDALASLPTTGDATIVVNSGDYSGEVFDLSGFSNNITVKFVEGDSTIGGLIGGANVTIELGGVDGVHNTPINLGVGGNNGSTTFAGDISGTGTLTKEGTGTLTLDGTLTVATIDAQAGLVDINGTVNVGAGLTITGPADVNIDGVVQDGFVSYGSQASAGGAVALWSMSETSGTTVVNSGSAGATIDGTHVNSPSLNASDVNGDSDGAMNFNGVQNASGDHIEISGLDSVAGGNPFENDWTIEAWFVRDSKNQWSTIASNNFDNDAPDDGRLGPIMTFISTTNKLGFMASGRSANGVSVDLGEDSLGKPVYAVITKTGGNGRYEATITVHANVDGQWLTSSTGTNSGGAIQANDGFYIGRFRTGAVGSMHDGIIDEVAVYDRALSLEEIQAHYVTTRGVTKSGDGTLTLNGANTFISDTNVTGGTLRVMGDSSAATGTVTVGDGATLEGTGTLGGNVIVDPNGTLSPGVSSIGTFTVNGNVTINGNFALDIAPGAGNTDFLNVGGAIEVSGGTLQVSGTGDQDDYVFVNYASAAPDPTVFAADNAPAGYEVRIDEANNEIRLSVNRPPVAVDDDNNYSAIVGGDPIAIPVLLNDYDPDGDVLSIDPTSLTTSVNGATISLWGEASGITNVNLINGYELEDLTVSMGGIAVTLTPDQMVGIDVTQFAGNNNFTLFVQDGTGAPANGSRAEVLDTDNRLETALGNPAVGSTTQMNAGTNIGTTVQFDQAVSSAVMFEVWANDDPINVQVSSDGVNWSNAVNFNAWSTSIPGLPATGTVQFDVYGPGSTPGSLNDIETASLSRVSEGTQGIAGMVINASAFSGVTSFTHMRYSSADSDSVDPSFIRGLPPVSVISYDPGTASATGTVTDTFTYKVLDGNGGEDTGTVTVTLSDSAAPLTAPLTQQTSAIGNGSSNQTVEEDEELNEPVDPVSDPLDQQPDDESSGQAIIDESGPVVPDSGPPQSEQSDAADDGSSNQTVADESGETNPDNGEIEEDEELNEPVDPVSDPLDQQPDDGSSGQAIIDESGPVIPDSGSPQNEQSDAADDGSGDQSYSESGETFSGDGEIEEGDDYSGSVDPVSDPHSQQPDDTEGDNSSDQTSDLGTATAYAETNPGENSGDSTAPDPGQPATDEGNTTPLDIGAGDQAENVSASYDFPEIEPMTFSAIPKPAGYREEFEEADDQIEPSQSVAAVPVVDESDPTTQDDEVDSISSIEESDAAPSGGKYRELAEDETGSAQPENQDSENEMIESREGEDQDPVASESEEDALEMSELLEGGKYLALGGAALAVALIKRKKPNPPKTTDQARETVQVSPVEYTGETPAVEMLREADLCLIRNLDPQSDPIEQLGVLHDELTSETIFVGSILGGAESKAILAGIAEPGASLELIIRNIEGEIVGRSGLITAEVETGRWAMVPELRGDDCHSVEIRQEAGRVLIHELSAISGGLENLEPREGDLVGFIGSLKEIESKNLQQ